VKSEFESSLSGPDSIISGSIPYNLKNSPTTFANINHSLVASRKYGTTFQRKERKPFALRQEISPEVMHDLKTPATENKLILKGKLSSSTVVLKVQWS
jgi:hypothetical protein